MKDRALFWWRDRTLREQRLLVLLAIIAVPTLLWIAVIRPVGHLIDHERVRRDEAERRLGDVQAMSSELDRVRQQQIQALPGALPAAVRSSAEGAGFTVSRLDTEGTDGAVLAIDAARAQPFFSWLATVQAHYGLVVTRLTAQPNSDATLAVSVSLRRRKN